MRSFKAILKPLVPEALRFELRRLQRETVQELRWMLGADRLRSALRARKYKNKHWGERCFIIGNGPSLQKMDLTPLADEVTFGLNRIYLLFKKAGFQTTYYACVNRLVIEQCVEEIAVLSMPKFISWYSRDLIPDSANTMYVRHRDIGPDRRFSKDFRKWIWEGATVTYVAMQIAYFMGFGEVVLIGVDHNFATKGEPHKEIISTGDDMNHFDPLYFGKGFRWQLPDLKTSELAYRLAKDVFESEGRRILDATVDGNLNVFPKVDFEDIIKSK